ncbi:hypothetical protein DGG96_10335 [Legionella qingyii]|uniref:Glycosyltransferase n=1 Tax=Legionella qingyii TaxID=2184757 RepID=A0A317U5D1_9GAMM|nr:sugar transferase [Legionella qingyii]PWY55682.1 hypothetical protein DGG96_10335 [Legionella qingyii]RUR21650.1 glycosyltransferase [Legionella qingyii]RUR25082.1 glycosyltransferase [Legionella qingyii]
MGVKTFAICLFLLFYHHIGYPLLLTFIAKTRKQIHTGKNLPLHQFIFIIPMYNEAKYIAKKIANLAKISYPADHYEVWLLDDGSVDKTANQAQAAIKKYPQLKIKIFSSPTNQGKVAWFNQIIPKIDDDFIIFFSDVSATLSRNVLKKANAYFNNPQVGVYCTSYKLRKKEVEGEKYYWQYQNDLKAKESKLGTPIGYHGTGYALRKLLWKKIPPNTINEDFVIPLQVIAQTYTPKDLGKMSLSINKKSKQRYKNKFIKVTIKNFVTKSIRRINQAWKSFMLRKRYWGVYDPSCASVENEISTMEIIFQRRIRLAAGNIQQVFLLFRLLSPSQGWVAWMFFSCKVLRIFMPWLLIFLFISNVYLAHDSFIFLIFLIGQILFYFSCLSNILYKTKITEITSYFIYGHLAMLLGWFYFFKLNRTGRWKRSNKAVRHYYIHPIVYIGKWFTDKVFALTGLLLLLCIGPLVAIIIKVFSPGPIFYKQLRVGLSNEKQTKMFYLYKFRTMNINTRFRHRRWTSKNDPRVFRFGYFMRKTHLDELPQVINILKGDMSLIGPRPERPSLFPYIVKNIPFYQERLFGVRPGLTGLAQVSCHYDRTIEDVKRKVAFDHAYATYLTKPWIWFKTDMYILSKTIIMILFGKSP